MSTTTRRGFLAGALASTSVPGLARAAEGDSPPPDLQQARRETVRRGRAIAVAPDGRLLVVAHDHSRTIAIHGPGRGGGPRLVDIGGQPLEVAVSPDGRLAAVTTAFWDQPGLALVDLSSAAVRNRLEVGPAPFDVAFTPDGRRAIVSGGEQEGTVHVVDTQRSAVVAAAAIGSVPRGLALDPGGRRAWIALNGQDRVVGVEIKTGRVGAVVRTPRLPDRVAASADGRRLLVSHGGRDAAEVSEIVIATRGLSRHRAGRLPSAVAWSRSGRRLVALGGAGEVVVFGNGGRSARRQVGGAPRGLAVAGRHAWTVDALSGSIDRVKV